MRGQWAHTGQEWFIEVTTNKMNHYVDLNIGDNANGGTSNTDAWLTTDYANNNSSDGDTIILVDGTFTPTAQYYHYFVENRTYRPETFMGLTINGSLKSGIDNWDFLSRIYVSASNADCTIENIHFKDFTDGRSASGVIGVTATGAGKAIFNGCRFERMQHAAWNNTGGLCVGGHTQFNGCLFKDWLSEQHATYKGYNRALFYLGSQLDFTNCTFYKENVEVYYLTTEAIFSVGVGTTLNVERCIMYNNSGVNTNKYYYTDTGTETVTNSDNYNFAATKPTAGINGNIEADPLMVDEDNGCYELRPGSPCFID